MKKLSAIILVLIAAFGFSACNGQASIAPEKADITTVDGYLSQCKLKLSDVLPQQSANARVQNDAILFTSKTKMDYKVWLSQIFNAAKKASDDGKAYDIFGSQVITEPNSSFSILIDNRVIGINAMPDNTATNFLLMVEVRGK